MNNTEIAQAIEPFEEGLSKAFPLAWDNVIRTVPQLGNPTKIERANCMHRAIRNVLQPICEDFSPILEFVEEPDGQGKDYIIINPKESDSLALCWGRHGDGQIRRCPTVRNQYIYDQGLLFPLEDESSSPRITATIGYDVADDFTEGGKPCWWMQRLVLIRERHRCSEFIKTICYYEKPEVEEIAVDDYNLQIREKQSRKIKEITDLIRKKIG